MRGRSSRTAGRRARECALRWLAALSGRLPRSKAYVQYEAARLRVESAQPHLGLSQDGEYGRGVVAMARSSQPHSQGSQFFIVLDDSGRDTLAQYDNFAILGHVTSGIEAVDAIAAAADQEIPTHPVAMEQVSVSSP